MGLNIAQIRVDTANLADGHSIAAYLTSAAGSLFTHQSIAGRIALDVAGVSDFAEDSAHASGDYGTQVLAVRNDTAGSLVSADGDYAPLQVDASGRLRVVADIDINNDFVYAEDSAHASGDLGASVLLVRQDTLAASTSADGDYGNFKSTNLGELYVKDSSAVALLTTIDADTSSIASDASAINSNTAGILADTGSIDTNVASLLSELQSLTQAEDAAHVSGDAGVMSLAVRNDTPGSLVSADGDYAPLQVDASGNLRVSGTVSISGTFAEDSAHSSGDSGMQVLAVRKDANGSNVSADGDYASLIQWLEGSLKVVDIRNGAVLQSQFGVTSTAQAIPATALAGRKTIIVSNTSNEKIYIGSATVTASGATQGMPLIKGDSLEMNAGPAMALYAIKSGAGTATINVLELA